MGEFLESAALGPGIQGNAHPGLFHNSLQLSRPETASGERKTLPVPIPAPPQGAQQQIQLETPKTSRKSRDLPAFNPPLLIPIPPERAWGFLLVFLVFQLVGISSSKKCPSCPKKIPAAPLSRITIRCFTPSVDFSWFDETKPNPKRRGKGRNQLERQDLGFYPVWNFPWMDHPRCSETPPILGQPPTGAAVPGATIPGKHLLISTCIPWN